MSLLVIILISCAAMVVKDFVATFLTIAEACGRAGLSGVLNALGTPANIIFYSYGSVAMIHGHGWEGWLGIIPVMCIDLIDGYVFTRLGNRIEPKALPLKRKTA